jgi:type I protein arginine methyltransferase
LYSLAGYGRMISDHIRTDAYAHALEHDIRVGDIVADIGTGPGILALLACRFGAKKVYAFEPCGVIELAREIAAANGFADRIEFISKKSTESSLPERVNAIISDVHGILPFFDHGLVSVIDARERFLAPGGRMIPQSDTVWIAGVHAPELHRESLEPWSGRPYGFDMSAACLRTTNSISQCFLTSTDQLSLEPRCLATLDYMTLKQADLHATVSWTVEHASQVHGIALWFESVLTDGVTLTNRPGAPRLIYRQAFFPWPEALQVSSGDTVTVTISTRLVGNEYVWRWDTQLMSKNSQNGAKPPFRQSTFLGSDLSLADLRTSASKFQPQLNEDGRIHRRVLSLMEGKMSLEDISHELVKDFPSRFKRRQDAFNLVASISRNFGS